MVILKMAANLLSKSCPTCSSKSIESEEVRLIAANFLKPLVLWFILQTIYPPFFSVLFSNRET